MDRNTDIRKEEEMSIQNKNTTPSEAAQQKQTVLNDLRQSGEIYVIMSNCTNLPFICCDEETYDDEIFLFRKVEDAQAFGQELQKAKNPIKIAKLTNNIFLGFYTMLYSIGVNCILVDKGTDREFPVQLEDLVKLKKPESEAANGVVRIENPALHLTAAYFMQKFRAGHQDQEGVQAELEELQEELQAHFRKGKYIVGIEEEKGVPILKNKTGEIYQPVFTDMTEFLKFGKGKKYKTAIVEFEGLTKMLSQEATGVVVNPLGVNVTFQIHKNQK